MVKKQCEFVTHCDFCKHCDGPDLCDRRIFYIEKLLELKRESQKMYKSIQPDCPYEVFCKVCHDDPDCCNERTIFEGFEAFVKRRRGGI
jgi:hypothetical protein